MATRQGIRNIGIVAHVDHGKTTLVDALLWQSGAFRAGQDVADRVLDSMDLEREKGITILAKNTAVHYGGVKLKIVDTPGLVPARGLIGFRTEFLTKTRGTGLMHHVFDRWEPWQGELRTRPAGSLVADRRGTVAAFALFKLQERGTLFVAPGDEVYEGMIIGESSRAEDLDVNPTKEKHLTNMRSSTADELVRLVPKRELSLDQALEFLGVDEAVEVTPHAVRLRKAVLDGTARRKQARSARQAAAAG